MSLHAAVQQAFGDQVTVDGADSLHDHSLVWRARVHGPDGDVQAIVKRTWGSGQHALEAWQRALVAHGVRTVEPLLPAVEVAIDRDGEVEHEHWVAYPYLHGRAWDGSADDLRAAGRALGQMHAASATLAIDGFPPIEEGSAEAASIAEDVESVRDAVAEHWKDADASRWVAQLEAFGETLAAVDAGQAPHVPVSLDHRAANLLFDEAGALVVDLENAALAPRILDLAVAVLLFPLEHEGSAGRALSREEWLAMLEGYLETAPRLDDGERGLWPTALTYMKLEWGTWHLTEGVETDPANLAFLEDLLTLDETERYALP